MLYKTISTSVTTLHRLAINHKISCGKFFYIKTLFRTELNTCNKTLCGLKSWPRTSCRTSWNKDSISSRLIFFSCQSNQSLTHRYFCTILFRYSPTYSLLTHPHDHHHHQQQHALPECCCLATKDDLEYDVMQSAYRPTAGCRSDSVIGSMLSLASEYASQHILSRFPSPEIGRVVAGRAAGVKVS